MINKCIYAVNNNDFFKRNILPFEIVYFARFDHEPNSTPVGNIQQCSKYYTKVNPYFKHLRIYLQVTYLLGSVDSHGAINVQNSAPFFIDIHSFIQWVVYLFFLYTILE